MTFLPLSPSWYLKLLLLYVDMEVGRGEGGEGKKGGRGGGGRERRGGRGGGGCLENGRERDLPEMRLPQKDWFSFFFQNTF